MNGLAVIEVESETENSSITQKAQEFMNKKCYVGNLT